MADYKQGDEVLVQRYFFGINYVVKGKWVSPLTGRPWHGVRGMVELEEGAAPGDRIVPVGDAWRLCGPEALEGAITNPVHAGEALEVYKRAREALTTCADALTNSRQGMVLETLTPGVNNKLQRQAQAKLDAWDSHKDMVTLEPFLRAARAAGFDV